MASAMAKLVSFLCLSLLAAQVTHVESGRPLRQYHVRVESYATTSFPAGETERSEVAGPVTTETEYHYTPTDSIDTTPEDVATEEVFVTEGIVEGETTPETPVGQQSYMFDTAMPSHRWYAAMPFSVQTEEDDQDDRDD